MAEKEKEVEPRCNPCPHCGGELIYGYGLAGGGCGVYLYCEKCQKIIDKWQDPEMQEERKS